MKLIFYFGIKKIFVKIYFLLKKFHILKKFTSFTHFSENPIRFYNYYNLVTRKNEMFLHMFSPCFPSTSTQTQIRHFFHVHIKNFLEQGKRSKKRNLNSTLHLPECCFFSSVNVCNLFFISRIIERAKGKRKAAEANWWEYHRFWWTMETKKRKEGTEEERAWTSAMPLTRFTILCHKMRSIWIEYKLSPRLSECMRVWDRQTFHLEK